MLTMLSEDDVFEDVFDEVAAPAARAQGVQGGRASWSSRADVPHAIVLLLGFIGATNQNLRLVSFLEDGVVLFAIGCSDAFTTSPHPTRPIRILSCALYPLQAPRGRISAAVGRNSEIPTRRERSQPGRERSQAPLTTGEIPTGTGEIPTGKGEIPTNRLIHVSRACSFYVSSSFLVRVRVHADTHKCTRMYTNVHGCTRMYTDVHECTRIYTNVHGYTRMYTDINECTRIYTNVHGYARIYTNVHGYTRMYTDVHECTRI